MESGKLKAWVDGTTSEQGQSIDQMIEARKNLHEHLTEYCKEMFTRQQSWRLQELADMRKLPVDTLEKLEIFYVDSMAELLLPSYLGQMKDFGVISETNNKPIFHERWVIPIRDTDGLVQNLVGYSPNFDERYIYGTAKYYDRTNTMWGLENLEKAYEIGYAVLTEGITDAIRLRSIGIENAFGRCGTFQSDIVMRQLGRLRYGVIFLHDRDNAGDQTRGHWETTRFIRLNTFVKYKDVDEMLREPENLEWFMDYYNEAVRRLTECESRGVRCALESLTMQ